MEKGEIRIVELPEADGREQYGTRPALIMADTDDDIAILILFTTNVRALKFPNTLNVDASNRNGLNEQSVALTFQLRAIDEKRIQRTIGTLEQEHIETIDEDIASILQL